MKGVSMKHIDVAISGYGAVGKQVARLMLARQQRYRERFGAAVRITGVCGSSAGLCDASGLDLARLDERGAYAPGLSGAAFIDRVRADVLVEASPSDYRRGGPGRAYMLAAMGRRMHVIAVSKCALALDYGTLRDAARRHGVALKISGATASALPTIDLLLYNLAGCRIDSVEAILTGTTNYILSEMMRGDRSFATALREAERLGIAEPDPALDIDGWDTACKLTILANAAFDAGVDLHAMPRTGIAHVTPQDIAAWRAQGLAPRLVGRIDRDGETVRAGVSLQLYGADHPFAAVHGRSEAIRVVTDLMGEFTVVGGASNPLATAAAVLKDFEHILASGQLPLTGGQCGFD
jgi:homoserine dehydrogenase